MLVIFILGDTSYTIYFNSFYTEATSFTFCECLSIFCLFLSGDETTNLAQKNSFSYLGTSSSTFNRTTRQEYLLIIGVIIAGLDFVYLSQRYQRLSMTAFLIALIGFTTLAAFIVPNDIYERDVYHSMTRGVMKDSKVPDKRMSEGGINPQYGLQKGRSYFEEYSPVSPTSEQMKKDFLIKRVLMGVIELFKLSI